MSTKRVFFLSFFILGFTSLVAQLAIIREAIISFYGNELFVGLVLGFWLIWASIGSISLAKVFNRLNPLRILIGCHFLIPFIFFGEIILLRLARIALGNPGQTPDLILSVGYLLVATAPLCLFLGLQFSMAARALVASDNQELNIFYKFFKWLKKKFLFSKETATAQLISRGYFYETIGLAVGGLLFSFVLIYLPFICLFILLLIVNFFTLLFLVRTKVTRLALASLLVLIIVIRLIPGVVSQVDQTTDSWRYPNQELLAVKNSKFGNIAITKTGEQYNFYASGLFIGSTEESFFNEEIIHLPLLYHLQPKKVLLIGGGFNGAINEILEYPVEQVYYLELDPQLISSVEPYLPLDLLVSQKDHRLEVIFDDALPFLRETDQSFDVIIINLPNPSTVLLNRFYTIEFFAAAKQKLDQDGLLALYLTSLTNYSSPGLEDLTASVYQSLKRNYSSVVVLPEDNMLYIATDEEINYGPWPLQERFNQYNLENKLVTKDYIYYRLTNDQVSQTLTNFKDNQTASPNTIRRPVGYWHQNLFWLSSYHPKLTNFLSFTTEITLPRIIIASLILFFVIFYSLDVLIKKKERILATLTIIPEFSLLAVEIVFIFLFQIIYGYLYHRLSLIITMILLGIAIGTWLASYVIAQGKVKYAYLLRLYFVISLYFVALALIIVYGPEALEIPVFFYWLVFAAGFLVGLEFPWANKFYLQLKLKPDKKTNTIYSADLFGSALGAILTSIFLLPILGFTRTLVVLALLNFLAFVALFFLRQNFEDN